MPEITALSTADVQQRINSDPMGFYRQAADDMRQRGVEDAPTLTRVLEFVSPTQEANGLDAYERLLQAAGIRTATDWQAGYHASQATDFIQNGAGNRMLFTEFFARTWRQVAHANRSQRAVLLSGDGIVGGWQRPYADAMTPRLSQRVEPAIPLSELVAMTTAISGEDYRSFYLTYDAAQLRSYRVGESAEIPIADITGSENTIRLKKYGRGLKASYEELRRMRIDKLAWYIRLMAIQAEVDKVAAALAVLVAGDGNANSVPVTWDLNGDFGGTAGTLDLSSWIQYKLKFVQPYVLTTALMTEATALQLLLLDTGDGNNILANLNLGGMTQSLTPINVTSDAVRYGWTSEAPALTIVGFDRRFALEQVVEIGSSISEMDRFITNQTQVMTMTEVNGFAVLDSSAIQLLDVND